ncbi:adenylate/guanylate cyclase [Tolypothrix tenuis PCC 7101]|uniref:Adenylate/guanylate cyclase n=2 Tax=Tolypothrix TaxID=111782 RepID=A0A1Z4N940_9CYAN|nr:adenylate/guanylate cyclase domain-containing protein [Aulosira sp. FACHB-113]BAZ02238.1 adenylate/guanylate cyclase [Tolypothrix tenuis PCC 7101]BAZ73841.1 adenylate/guanylate cyclase [Aulosira laxa NIES-50]
MNTFISRVWRFFLSLLFKQTVLILLLLFSIGVGVALANMSSLSTSLIKSQALMNAELQAKSIIDAWNLYSSAGADRARKVKGISVIHNYLIKEGAIPPPATYAIELGKNISEQKAGMAVRLYSDYPYPWRKAEGGPRDDFEKQALTYLRQHPEENNFSRLEKQDGRSLWRYGQSVRMEASCVACHDSDPNSPKRDWQVGDVRGVLAITQSLDSFTEKTNKSLQTTFVMLGGLSVLGLAGLTLVISRLRQTTRELEVRVTERTADLAQANTDLEKRNSLIRQVFGRYLSDEIVANLLDSPEGLKLGGERRRITILTSDLRGFTAISERSQPEEVITILNIYLEYMADVITQYQGTINEFMGDGILVLFGAPMPKEDDAAKAVACACAMQLAMTAVNERLQHLGFPQLDMGIGINTGLVILGNIGSQKRTKYGVVGSQVNLTYRIESYTTGGEVLISDETLKAAGSIVQLSGNRQVQPKGVKQPITVHQVYGISGDYNLFLSIEAEEFLPLSGIIPIQYALLEEKHISTTIYQGSIVELSAKGAKIRMENAPEVSPPPAQTNIKLKLLVPNIPPELQEDIYAKVFDKPVENGSFYIHFTAKPPAIQARLDAIYQSLKGAAQS